MRSIWHAWLPSRSSTVAHPREPAGEPSGDQDDRFAVTLLVVLQDSRLHRCLRSGTDGTIVRGGAAEQKFQLTGSLVKFRTLAASNG